MPLTLLCGIIISSLLICLFVLSGGCTQCVYQNPAGTLTVNWRVNDTAIQFVVSAATTGWFAIGVNSDASMIGGDIFWVQASL